MEELTLTSTTLPHHQREWWIRLHNNDLTSVDFSKITRVGGNIRLFDNDLTSVNCTGVAINGCICVDDGVALTKCPAKCIWSDCNN